MRLSNTQRKPNHCIQLTVKSVTFFAKAKNAPLFTSADAGVMLMNKVLQSITNLFLGLLILVAFLYWAFSPGSMNVSIEEIEKEIEDALGFDLPPDFKVIKTWDYGYSHGDLYYSYEIEYEKESFDKFMERWSVINNGLSWKEGNPETSAFQEVIIEPDNRKITYHYADD